MIEKERGRKKERSKEMKNEWKLQKNRARKKEWIKERKREKG